MKTRSLKLLSLILVFALIFGAAVSATAETTTGETTAEETTEAAAEETAEVTEETAEASEEPPSEPAAAAETTGEQAETAMDDSFPAFIDWFKSSFRWMTVANGHWSNDPADKISDAELEQILNMAMLQQTAVHWTPYFMIAVKDVDEQRKILGDQWGDPETLATEGTVTVLVLADQVISEEQGHVTPYKDLYSVVDKYAYYDSGQASALLSVAANALGYSTHYFGSINGENAPVDITGTDENGVEYSYQSLDHYVKDEYMRTWGFFNPYEGEVDEEYVYPVKGNTVFICAIVIGKPAEGEEVESWGTNHARPQNWAIWD